MSRERNPDTHAQRAHPKRANHHFRRPLHPSGGGCCCERNFRLRFRALHSGANQCDGHNDDHEHSARH